MSGERSPLRLRHPGPPAQRRLESAAGSAARSFRLRLQAGATLHDALVAGLSAQGVGDAVLNLFGGGFSRVSYCIAVPLGEGAGPVAAYSPPLGAGPVMLIGANATLGRDEEGRAMVHCHALLVDPAGRVFGGHVIPEATIVAEEVPVAYARALDGLAVERRFDPETGMAMFHPGSAAGARDAGTRL